MLINITDAEKEVLARWVPGVDLSRVKIKTGPITDKVCAMLGAQAITIGYTIFASSKSWIVQNPACHPVRLALLLHEIFHARHEAEKGLPWYMLQYIAIALCLILRAIITKRWFTPRKLAHFIASYHPYEKPAYKLQTEFLNKYWTGEEAEKWKGVTPK